MESRLNRFRQLYPTKEIREKREVYNKTKRNSNITFGIGFGLLTTTINIFALFIKTKGFYIGSTIIQYVLLIGIFIYILINTAERRQIDQKQLEIAIDNEMNLNVELIKGRNKLRLASLISALVVLAAPLVISILSFIEGLRVRDYSLSPINVLVVLFALLFVLWLLGFVIGYRIHIRRQTAIIEQIEQEA